VHLRTNISLGLYRLYHLYNAGLVLFCGYRWALEGGFYSLAPSYYGGLFLIALAPLVNVFFSYDAQNEESHAGVRLPRVSAFVMLGSAWLLLGVPQVDWIVGLWLMGIAGFFLTTYAVD